MYSSEAFSIFACLKDYIFIVPILKSYPLPNASRRNRISRLIVHGGLDTFIFLDLFAVLGEEVENGLGWGYLWARGRLDLGYYGLTDHDESLAYRCLLAPAYGVCDSEYKFDFHEIILLDQRDLWTNFRISLGITNAHSTAGIWYQNVCSAHGMDAFPKLSRRVRDNSTGVIKRVVSCSGSYMDDASKWGRDWKNSRRHSVRPEREVTVFCY